MSESRAKVQSFSMGREVQRTTSSSSESDYFYFTRPEGISSKCGTSGTPVKLTSNHFEIEELTNFHFTQYRVDFVPELDIAKIRNALIGQQKAALGGYIYDGASSLFLTKELECETMQFDCTTRENQQYTLIIKKTKNTIAMTSKMGMMLLNVILRRAMGGLDLQLLRRDYYDPQAKIMLNDYKLELWPGYVTSIRIHENKILLCCEISHKVLRQETALDVLVRCHQDSNDARTAFKKEIIGTVVITRYNNKTYRVDDVDFSKSASSTFDMKGQQKSFVQYYQEQYGIRINDQNQPLLITNPKPRDIRGGRSEVICLVPELCNTTGLTEGMKTNFQLMKAMADYTRMDPRKRVERLMKFNERMLTTPKSAQIFDQFQTKLQPKLVELTGRQLNQETILFGNGKSAKNDFRVDWTNPMKMNEMYANEPLHRWGIIFPTRAANDTYTFLKLLEEVAQGMRYDMKKPKMIEISDDRTTTYARELENFISKDPKFVMTIVPNANADRYSAIKKITCVNNSIPTQVIVQKTMQPKKGNIGSVKSIATKVLIQINCKLGGCAWMVNIPIKGLMTVGFDVSRDAQDKKKSYGAFVASMDLKESTKFFSSVAAHSDGEECSRQIALHMTKALISYMDLHGTLPSRILFYRDGVGEGDIERVHTQEIKQIQEAVAGIYRSNGAQSEPNFAFIIVTKRINTRFFSSKGSSHENPTSGTVIDSVVTLPERYDFYLISQSVRQGTVSPTSYNVIYDTLGLTPDKIQLLTYKMCHLYYNWSGTTRVPCVIQYAQKLGVLVSQYLHQPPSESLNNSLYFL
jgi:aubergine-like protein